ncbi:hypothetical protein A3752_19880 [Oleiphilus sp. HI0081]|uniref:hypothetical protein n=1 Tax=unclassified Oleiphilus TaxID=2631174 RepID=UPI0007C2C40F|nr:MULTISPECIES: hypothetical protein [unclassified Oleiphilus]KZY84997.1 hypothetical protein A3743_20080 [Oleiphilus sp. HI0072]KZZ20022.1 hypothetical protein A3749_19880 [Oleiphilus sp. HI0078]KZZ29105.1 hypothetical protein A3752_19880 [Oleiphilus sp. HI0081]KZY31095.1 hypothetical protein A3729_09560 [Oleiphilus sp. HI0043]KZY57433.1 hypothetical protein A3735_18565 [Oleiphilus sp. HI0061]
MKKKLKAISIVILVVVAFLIGGGYGYSVANKDTTARWLSSTAGQALIDRSLVSEAIKDIDHGNVIQARETLSSLSVSLQIQLKQCVESELCQESIKNNAAKVFNQL